MLNIVGRGMDARAHEQDTSDMEPEVVALLRLVEGQFGFVDVSVGCLRGDRKLVCELTLRDGKVEEDPEGETRWNGIGST